MLRFSSKSYLHDSKLMKKQKEARSLAQFALDQQILMDSNYYAPEDIETLQRSGLLHSRIGKGHIEWKTPYARRLYYNPQYNFSKDENPNAQGLWFETAKATYGKVWAKIAGIEYRKLFNGK